MCIYAPNYILTTCLVFSVGWKKTGYFTGIVFCGYGCKSQVMNGQKVNLSLVYCFQYSLHVNNV